MSANLILNDEFFMREALKEAKLANKANEIPIGAIIVCNNQIIAKAHNQTEQLNDPTAHAEMLAFTAATDFLGAKYLNKCSLYVTVEPCPMCAGASYWVQLGKIIYGTTDIKRGYSTVCKKILHPKTSITSNVLQKECADLMTFFFKNKR